MTRLDTVFSGVRLCLMLRVCGGGGGGREGGRKREEGKRYFCSDLCYDAIVN